MFSLHKKIIYYTIILFLISFLFVNPALALECCCTQDRSSCIDKTAEPCPSDHPDKIITSQKSCQNLQKTQQILKQRTGWVSSVIGRELIPASCAGGKQEEGQCGINEIIQLIINITRLMLGVMGSFALLMFTLGGLYYIISFGNSGRVEKAKSVLTAAIWGLIIILTAWTIINFIVIALTAGGSGIGGNGIIFGQDWTKFIFPK